VRNFTEVWAIQKCAMVDSVKNGLAKANPTTPASIDLQGFLVLPPVNPAEDSSCSVPISDYEEAAARLRTETGNPNVSVADVLRSQFASSTVNAEVFNHMATAAREQHMDSCPHLRPVGLAPQVGAAPVANLRELFNAPLRA
jgi:hypothetical protein